MTEATYDSGTVNNKNEAEETPKVRFAKWREAVFLTSVTGMSMLFGFGATIASAKKKDPVFFDKGMSSTLRMESGGSLAARALGWGSLYAVTGCGVLFYSVWKLMGVKDLQEFRIKAGNILPRIPKNDPPQGRTEFKNLTDLLQYFIDEDDRIKKDKLKVKDESSKISDHSLSVSSAHEIFIEVTTNHKTTRSEVISWVDNNEETDTTEKVIRNYVNDLVSHATYNTPNNNDDGSKTATNTVVGNDFQIQRLGYKNGLKYLHVTLPPEQIAYAFHYYVKLLFYCLEIFSIQNLGTSKYIFQLLRDYLEYRVPIYVPLIFAILWFATYKPDPNEICFAHVGCFSLEHPWTERPLIFNFVPQSPSAVNTTFTIYSRDVRDGFNISGRSKHPDVSQFVWANKPLIIIIHGYTDNAQTWIRNLTYAFLENEDANVIGVDWNVGAAMYYPQVVANTRVVAAEIAIFLEYLKTTKGENLEYIHLVGHSLGSHISGYVGKMFHGISKITALDPAAPLFESVPQGIRLDKSDAEEVEVVHSNVAPFGFGLNEPVGTTDIYLNDGQDQYGCKPMLEIILNPPTVETISDIKDTIACSHRRAYEIFEEAIRSQYPLYAHPCPSWEAFQRGKCLSHCDPRVGGCYSLGKKSMLPSPTGIYYMMTTDKYTFCSQMVRIKGHICDHQIRLQNVQLYYGFSELNVPRFEGTITKLQPVEQWVNVECHKLKESPLQLYIQFDTKDIVQAPICFSKLYVEFFNQTLGTLQRYHVNYTEVYRGDCSVIDLKQK